MRTNEINKMIEQAVEDERESGRLAGTLKQLARQNGANPSKQALRDAVSFVREYVEHVPCYLEEGATSAGQLGLSTEMRQMLSELENYWFEANDIIPDHLGLLGLMDDAYATLLLLQSLSDYCQATHGVPLLKKNFTQANQAIRSFIGEPGASMLEQGVGATIGNAMMQHLLSQAVGAGFAFGGGRDPMWGDASMDEVVTARLGAMGVV